MKKIALIIGIIGLIFLWKPGILIAQTPDYKVVFDLTSKDTNVHKMVIRWVKEISKSDPAAQTEVVLYGKSLDMLVKDRSTVADDLSKLVGNKNTTFKVCAIAMKNQQVEKSQLLPGIQIVPDGIYEIISKQKQNWGYIKVAN